MDRRQRKTRNAIFNAFTALLKEQSYTRITVQQITFYAHFETKDDLLRELCTEIFDHVFSPELIRETTHDFSGETGVRARAPHLLYHLNDVMDVLSGVLSGESGDIFMSYFRPYLSRLFQDAVSGDADVPNDYMLNRMVCDFAETVRWWTANRRFSPEDVSRFYLSAAPYLQDKTGDAPYVNNP
jgi:AcrR family transcriptional regulator